MSITRRQFLQAAQDHPEWLNAITPATQEEQPATLEELTAAFPNADAPFVLKQLSERASLSKARAAESAMTAETLRQLKAENEDLKRRLADNDPGEAGLTSPLASFSSPANRGGLDPYGRPNSSSALADMLTQTGHIPEPARR